MKDNTTTRPAIDGNNLLSAGIVVVYDNEKFRVHSQNEDVKHTLIEDDTRLFQVETRLLRVVQPCR